MSRRKKTIRLELDVKKDWEVGHGHIPHRGGGGEHQDKRNKRNRTRSSQKRNSIKESKDE